jgi:hypothetical protein
MNKLILLILVASITSCATWKQPTTQGDPKNANNYGYHPMDPLPVGIKFKEVENDTRTLKSRMLDALPDETMRLAIGQINNSGGISFGTATTGYKGNNYVVVLDYIKFNTESFGVKLNKATDTYSIASLTDTSDADVIVPVYVGVGLRLTANITVLKGEVDLGNLFAIGGQASSEKISGTLVVQTSGISGKNVSSAIPMPSEINSTTIQNAILALGTIKAVMYESDTKVTPRVVGVYNTLGGGSETINGFISSILQRPKELYVD